MAIPFPLVGKTAVITGATGGIGFAIASRFAREGADVVLVGRNQSKLDSLVQQLHLEKPWMTVKGQALYTHCFDAQTLEGWQGLPQKHPEIDILVNCAGQAQTSLLLRASEAEIERLLAVNLRSAIWGCKTVSKQMISRRRGGCIINVSSLLAHKASVGTSVYAAAKAGQLGLTTSLSKELARYRIRVNAIVPGYIETPMTESIAESNELVKRIPLGRLGKPDEVADAAAFLAKNEYANNCILNLDGGLSAV